MERSVEEVGRIFGDVGLGQFHLLLTRPVERGDYVAVEDEQHGNVLCQMDDLRRKSDFDVERAGALSGSDDVAIHQNLLGVARVIGYRDGAGIVKCPTIPFRPGARVYRADEPLIAEVLGLKHRASRGA